MAPKKVKLEIIPEPKPGVGAVLVSDVPNMVYMKGPGGDDYVCGSCGQVLVEAMPAKTIQVIVFRCTGCRLHNRINSPNTN